MTTTTTPPDLRSALLAAAELLTRITDGASVWSLQEAAEIRDQLAAALAAPASAAPAYHVPGPYEIALAVGAALCAAGTYATPGAALAAAWFAIPEFYMARDKYLAEMAPMFATSPRDPGGEPDRTNLPPAGLASAESPAEGGDNATEH